MTESVLYNAFMDVVVKVHSDGRIETLDHTKIRANGRTDNRKGRILKPSIDKYGYEKVTLTSGKVRKTFFVHRLVASAFLPNSSNKPTVNHINGNKRDNSVSNLEWATQAEQKAHSIRTGLCIENIQALSIANKRRSLPVVYGGVRYRSIREASRILGVDRKKIKNEGGAC